MRIRGRNGDPTEPDIDDKQGQLIAVTSLAFNGALAKARVSLASSGLSSFRPELAGVLLSIDVRIL